MKQTFHVLFHPNQNLGKTVFDASLDLSKSTLTVNMLETEDFSVLSWLVSGNLRFETLTFVAECPNPKVVLCLQSLTLLSHEFHVSRPNEHFGINTPDKRFHSVTLRFDNIEVLNAKDWKTS